MTWMLVFLFLGLLFFFFSHENFLFEKQCEWLAVHQLYFCRVGLNISLLEEYDMITNQIFRGG